MVVFEDGELEIAVVTYNRCDFIKQWLEKCYSEIIKRNIKLSIYDSSTNDDTYNFLNDSKYDIAYHRVDQNETIGYKPMFPILNSNSKYLWVAGDSRYHDFNELDKKVFPHIKNNLEYILLQIATNAENDGKIYKNKSEFLRECFISTTCIGLSIYRTSIFEQLKTDTVFKSECDNKFRNNYAFSWLGYFLTVFSNPNYQAAFVVTKIYSINEKTKKQTWARRFYESWCQNVCELMDNIPYIYGNTDVVISSTWEYMSFNTMGECYKAWEGYGLTKEIFERYKRNGMLDRLHADEKRIRFFATKPRFVVYLYYQLFRVYRRIGMIFGFVDEFTRM